MVNIDVLNVLNEYYEAFKKGCGVFGRNELYRICLLPLLQDIIDGPLTPFVTDEDARYIDKYIKECFSYAIASNAKPVSYLKIYIGTGDAKPDEDIILNSSIIYNAKEGQFVSPDISENFFWVAIPKEYSISKVSNQNFVGDWLPLDYFNVEGITINDKDYTLYYTESVIPLSVTYVVSINKE